MMIVINQKTLNLYTLKLDKLISELRIEKINHQNKYTNEELNEISRLINKLERFRSIAAIHANQAIVALSLLHEQDDKGAKERSESIIMELTQEALKLKESITEIQKKLALRKENEFLFSMITGITTVIVAPILFISAALLLGPVASLPLTMIIALLAPAPISLAIPFFCVALPFGLSYMITSIFLDEPYDPAAEELLLGQKKKLQPKLELLQLLKDTSINSLPRNIVPSAHRFFNHQESQNPSHHQGVNSTHANEVGTLSGHILN